MARTLPSSASIAVAKDGAKLIAPSATRNCAALTGLLRDHAPLSGDALEIASGTGQHISAFATALPDLHWCPSEVDAARRASIDTYVKEAELCNVSAAATLDATAIGWGAKHRPKDMIFLVNLLHLISGTEVHTLINEAAIALENTGVFIIYGPFKRNCALISEGDTCFDAELRRADPAIGYKDDLDIIRWLSDAGFKDVKTTEMPANNLAFIARKTPQ